MRRSKVAKRVMKILGFVAIAGFALFSVYGQISNTATAPKIPKFKYDGAWPKLPLPNAWTFEGITGLTVDKDDVVWVLDRQERSWSFHQVPQLLLPGDAAEPFAPPSP